jgi:hypothetical protein
VELIEWDKGFAKYKYLAINTTWNGLIWIAYIVFVTKMQKSKPYEMDLPLLKDDITGSEPTVKMLDK